MSEEFTKPIGGKREKYESLLPQIVSVVSAETDIIANMANVSAMLHATFGFWWTGFYRVEKDMLVLGPFQGPMACTRIPRGRGVCGAAWEQLQTIIVPDVEQFPGHIACSSASRSEIVVPLIDSDGMVAGVLDIDSDRLGAFDQTDAFFLEKAASAIMASAQAKG